MAGMWEVPEQAVTEQGGDRDTDLADSLAPLPQV